jgi:acyl carrier protein
MADGSISERVIRVFADFKKVDPSEIRPETTFEELGFDSLDGLNLIFELEEEFDVVVPDDKVQSMRSVSEVIDGIETIVTQKENQPAAEDLPAQTS